jgi:hypothetical protein
MRSVVPHSEAMDTQLNSARNRIYQVTDLEPETILEVADRTAVATTFEDLIYRESEVDAMWSLVDIQVRQAELAQSPELEKWLRLRELLWEAHDLIPEGKVVESSEILRRLASMV